MKKNPLIFLAGGCVRSSIANEPINDFDLFTRDKETAKSLANSLAKDKDRALGDDGLLPGIYTTDNAYTLTHFKPAVQIIHRWAFEKPEDCIKSFDFTIAQAAVWHDGNKWQSATCERFYCDLAAKRLIYTSPVRDEEAGGSLLRVLKFYQRGYRIPLDSMGAVIGRLVAKIDQEKISLQNTTAVNRLLTALLVEVDPNIDPKHIAHLPSETEENSHE